MAPRPMMLFSCEKKDNSPATSETVTIEENNTTVGKPEEVKADPGTFKLQPLGYAYDAFPNAIDAKTMELHYSKHYVGYLNKLNKAVAGTAMEKMALIPLLKNMDMNNSDVRNNAGGVFNHELFFSQLKASPATKPTGALAAAIDRDFGSYDAFKKAFTEAAAKRFGSGWAWLVSDEKGTLKIGSTANQDNPLMPGMEVSGTPVMGLDVWEHSYYLKYQNKRPEYIDSFFTVLDWDTVGKRYDQILNPTATASAQN